MKRVLLIEDDRFLIEDLATFIEFEGHHCECCHGPDEVIEMLDRLAQFDVVILDIMMARGKYLQDEDPRMETGELLYQRIRQRYPDMQIVVISAKNFEDMTIDFTSEKNVSLVAKPLDSTASELIRQL